MNSNQNQEGSEQFSLVGLLLMPFTAVKEVFDEYSGSGRRSRSRYEEKSLAERIMGFFTLPFRLLFGFFMFLISSWSTSRNGYAFLKAVPVLGAVGGFGGALLVADLANTEGKRLAHNLGHLGYHSGESPEFCEMFARNLINLKAEPENIYQLGMAYDRVDEPTKAYDVMRYLAPDNMLEELLGNETGGSLSITPGFSNAHIWLSQYYAKTRTLDITDELRDTLVEQHLRCAVDIEPENKLALFNLAMLHLSEVQKREKGSPEYRELAEKTIEEFEGVVNETEGITRLQLLAMPKLIELQIEVEENQIELQKRLAQQINRLQPLADRFPDEVDILLTMVRCAILMEDFPRALSIVRNGFQLAKENTSKQKIVAISSMIYLEHAGKYADLTNPIQFRGRIHTLAEAVMSNPREREIYIKLLDFVGTIPSEPGVINQEWLSDSINGAKNPGIIHCLLGFKKVSAGNVLEGEKHWRIAERQFVSSRLIINNLIDVAAAERPNEFKDLLQTMGLAIEMFPDQPIFLRTRGVFLASLERYEEAIEDLVAASEKLPSFIDIHQHLIKCYEKTGQEEKAFEQKQILENKLGLLGEAQRKQLEAVIGEIAK